MSLYSEQEVNANERFSIINGSYATVGISIVSNFAPLFVLRALHATSQEVALLNSLPALMAIVATWLGALWMSAVQSKKKFCVRASFVARFFYILLATVPFFVHGSALALVVVLLIAIMNFPQSFTALSWQSLIADLVPDDHRAHFFSVRNRITTFVGMLATLLPGIILQFFPVSSVPPYQAFFFVAALCSVMEIYYLIRHKEHVDQRPDRKSPVILNPKMFVVFLRRPTYRRFVIGAVIFNVGWQMAWPLFNIFQIKYAGATAIWVSSFTVANQISQIVTYMYWGKLSEKFGNSITLAIACFGMAVSPVLTMLSTGMVYLVIINLLTGTFVAGVNVLQFNHLLDVAPQEHRTAYIAHFNIVMGFVGFIAPEIGVNLLSWISMDPAMIVSSLLRAGGGLFFFFVVAKAIVSHRGNTTASL